MDLAFTKCYEVGIQFFFLPSRIQPPSISLTVSNSFDLCSLTINLLSDLTSPGLNLEELPCNLW